MDQVNEDQDAVDDDLAGTKTGVNDYRGKSVLFTPGPIYPGKIVV